MDEWFKRHLLLSAIVGGVGMIVAVLGATQLIWSLFRSEPLLPYISTTAPQCVKIILAIVFITIFIFCVVIVVNVYRQTKKASKEKPLEQSELDERNYELVKAIPTLITGIDKRRAGLMQIELDKRMASGDTQFVFNILNDAWCTYLGAEPPTLPTRIGDEDIGTIISIMLKWARNYKDGIEELKKRIEKLGDLETGLILARAVNKHLGIDDELAKESMNETLKSARGLLPSSVAVETTKAIDNYLAYSRAYRATDIVLIPLTKMIEENDILKSIPQMKQIINIFQRFKEAYLDQMNINLAKVNEALKLL